MAERPTILDVARLHLGPQETLGRNDGLNIRVWKTMLGPGVAGAAGIPWCAVFVAAKLMERNKLSRKQLVAKLGFRPGSTYLESCDSWLAEAGARGDQLGGARLVDAPRPGDLFLLMAHSQRTGYSQRDAIHIGFVASVVTEGRIATIEGNTSPGLVEGASSRDGQGAYERSRLVDVGRLKFIRLPVELTGLGGAS